MDIFTAENYTADRAKVTSVLAASTIYAAMLGNIGRHITCRSSTRTITLQVPFNTVVPRWQNCTTMAQRTLAQRHQLCRTSKWIPNRTLNALPNRYSNRYQPPLLHFLWFHPWLLQPPLLQFLWFRPWLLLPMLLQFLWFRPRLLLPMPLLTLF
jgi:hypothetical protein